MLIPLGMIALIIVGARYMWKPDMIVVFTVAGLLLVMGIGTLMGKENLVGR